MAWLNPETGKVESDGCLDSPLRILDIHGRQIKVGDAVRVYTLAPLPYETRTRPHNILGTVIKHNTQEGIAIKHQDEVYNVWAFRLEVVP